MRKFAEADNAWLDELMRTLRIDPRVAHPSPVKSVASFPRLEDVTIIDLRHIAFISIFDLITLYLIADFSQACKGTTHLRFSGLGPHELPILNIDHYNDIRGGRRSRDSVPYGEAQYVEANRIYRFISFLHHFGLINALSLQRDTGRIVFEGIDQELLSKLHQYSGLGSRILSLYPLRDASQLDVFMMQQAISAWLEGLPQHIREAPIFSDGEFSRVLGYQLALNVIEHSGHDFAGEYGALGVVAMRVIEAERFADLRQSFSPSMQNVFDVSGNTRGVLELCIGDRGAGITATLFENYASLLSKAGIRKRAEPQDIVAFAFDEVGSSKPVDARLGGVHALHRILRCVIKYHGIVRIRTSGYEAIYDATASGHFRRGKNGLGVQPTHLTEALHPWGTQIQIALPLCRPNAPIGRISPRGYEKEVQRSGILKPRVVPVEAHLLPITQCPVGETQPPAQLARLSTSLMIEPTDRTIIFDFSGRIWKEDEVVAFLISQKSVLHTHICVGVNCYKGLPRFLREREQVESVDWPEWRGHPKELFEILSTKHRLFPLLDSDRALTWLGLGRYEFDDVLRYIDDTGMPQTMENLSYINPSLADARNQELLTLYLDSNEGFFTKAFSDGGCSWKRRFGPRLWAECIEASVREGFGKFLNSLQCVHDSGLYKLPSRSGFTKMFYQSAPLFQDPVASQQLADWMSSAVRSRLQPTDKAILLVCTTAPVELAAIYLANTMLELDVFVLNLGHYSDLDKENLLNEHDWMLPTFVLTDIVDTQRTLNEMLSLLAQMSIDVRAVLALIRFNDVGEDRVFGECMFWDPPPDRVKEGEIPTFYVAETKRPESVTDAEAWERSEATLYFVEPFSLEPFDYESLSRRNPDKGRRTSTNVKNLSLLEELRALRWGHFIYGTHHFPISVAMPLLLGSDAIAGPIVSKVLSLCKAKEVTHILYPLHSNIGRIIPRIKSSIMLHLGTDVESIFCISTRALTARPFYLLPTRLKDAILGTGVAVSGNRRGLRILILDDAVASGRTLETILRALVLQCRSAIVASKTTRCPIESVDAISILDRQPLARGTLLKGIQRILIDMQNDTEGRTNEYGFSFSYSSWLAMDMLVSEEGACELCDERAFLQQLQTAGALPSNHSLRHTLCERLEELAPKSTESPAFLKTPVLELPRAMDVGRVEAHTFELAYLEFAGQMQSGYPMNALVQQYQAMMREYSQDDFLKSVGLRTLQREMVRAFLRSWPMVTSQWSGVSVQQALMPMITNGSRCAITILAEAGWALSGRNAKTSPLRALFSDAIAAFAKITDDSDSSLEKRENLYIGCCLYCVIYLERSLSQGGVREGRKYRVIVDTALNAVIAALDAQPVTLYADLALRNIRLLLEQGGTKADFLPALFNVLDHTVRARRSLKHAHLIPALLTRLIKAQHARPRELSLLRDTVSHFMNCLETVVDSFPALLSSERASAYAAFQHYGKRLLTHLEKHLDDSSVAEGLRDAASKLLNAHPYHDTNALSSCLMDMQVSVDALLLWLEREAAKRNITIFKDMPCEELYVLCQNTTLLRSIFENYTFGARPDKERGHVLIQVAPNAGVSSIKRITIKIRTNFGGSGATGQVQIGPGMVEFGARDVALFGIKSSCRAEKFTMDQNEYDSVIELELCQGLPVPQIVGEGESNE